MRSPPADLAVVAQDPAFGGGARRQIEAFCAGAAALGREPELVYLQYPWLPEDERSSDVTATTAAPTLRGVEALNQLVAARRLAPRVREARSAWVVAATGSHGLAAPLAGRAYGCWIGTTVDDEWRGRGLEASAATRAAHRLSAPILRRVERRVLAQATLVAATSAASRRAAAAAMNADEETIRMLPIPIDVDALRPADDEAWLKRLAEPTIVFVGRASDSRKNVPLLLDAFARLRQRRPEVRLRLVGEPPAPASPAHTQPGVEVVGAVPSVARELQRATLFALPSRQEGFGIVVAEAFACGVPAVVTPSGGPEESVRESGGGVVLRRDDPAEFADTLDELLADTDALARMRHAAREYVVREHAVPVFRIRLAALLEELDGLA